MWDEIRTLTVGVDWVGRSTVDESGEVIVSIGYARESDNRRQDLHI